MLYEHAPRSAVAATALAVLVAGCAAEEPEPETTEDPPVAPSPPEPEPEPEPPPPPPPPEDEPDAVQAYGVSAGHPDAVEAGMSVLADGGNAVDAAVAAAYAVGVVEPFASGIGGGGAALVASLDDDPVAYDYREVVPEGGIPASNTGIPGFVAGMGALHADHGSGELADLLAPAITLAREGATTSGILADQLRSAAHRLPTGQMTPFYPGGSALGAGDTLVQESLADTLERIAEHGAATFYEGDLGAELAADVDGIDTSSLAAYEVQQTPPASGTFAGHRVVAAAPPLPGVTLVQMLQMAEALGIEDHEPGSADFVHSIAMSWRLADETLEDELGDPDFVDVPLDQLTDPEHNAGLAGEVPMDTLIGFAPGAPPEQRLAANTTHITTVDAEGTLVSMTNTLTNFWGSGQYTHGFFANDQLRRFSIGRTAANEPAPGRRSVSWSLPAVVLDDEGRPVLGIGSPGGRRIPNILTQVLARWALHGQPIEDAVAAPRFHLEGSELEFEELPGSGTADDLRGRGYTQLSVPELPYYFGSVQVLEIDYDADEVRGARDERREADWRVERP